jgi:hypothetical protein
VDLSASDLAEYRLVWLACSGVLLLSVGLWRLRRAARRLLLDLTPLQSDLLVLAAWVHLFLGFASWWVGRLMAAFLFPYGPLHWVAAGMFYLVCLAFLPQFTLLFNRDYRTYEADLVRRARQRPIRLLGRELVSFAMAWAVLEAIPLLAHLAPTGEGWSAWAWGLRWVMFLSFFYGLGYLSTGNWRLAVQAIGWRPRLGLYLAALVFVLLLLAGHSFTVFVAWWFCRAVAGLSFQDGIAYWTVTVGLCSGIVWLSWRADSMVLFHNSNLPEHEMVARALLAGGGRLVLLELSQLILSVAILALVAEGLDGHSLAAISVVVILAALHAVGSRLRPRLCATN